MKDAHEDEPRCAVMAKGVTDYERLTGDVAAGGAVRRLVRMGAVTG